MMLKVLAGYSFCQMELSLHTAHGQLQLANKVVTIFQETELLRNCHIAFHSP